MNIKLSQFCSLATSADWQTWLYEKDVGQYKIFMEKLRNSKNCSGNAAVMKETLESLNDVGYGDDLEMFLLANHPHVMEYDVDDNLLFPDYVPGVLTYPHRIILSSDDRAILLAKDKKFKSSKGHVESIIVGKNLYIEYLEDSESGLIASIDEDNWLVRKWKSNQI